MRKILLILPLLVGCSQLAGVEGELIGQTRKGIAQLKQINDEKSQLIAQFQQEKRRALDEAFDEDARNQTDLSAEWVITTRRAYVVGLQALDRAQQQSDQTSQTAAQTADACDQALQKLQWFRELRTNLDFLKPGGKP